MEKISPNSSWNLPPTDGQMRSISEVCKILGVLDPGNPASRWEARNLIYDMQCVVRLRTTAPLIGGTNGAKC